MFFKIYEYQNHYFFLQNEDKCSSNHQEQHLITSYIIINCMLYMQLIYQIGLIYVNTYHYDDAT